MSRETTYMGQRACFAFPSFSKGVNMRIMADDSKAISHSKLGFGPPCLHFTCDASPGCTPPSFEARMSLRILVPNILGAFGFRTTCHMEHIYTLYWGSIYSALSRLVSRSDYFTVVNQCFVQTTVVSSTKMYLGLSGGPISFTSNTFLGGKQIIRACSRLHLVKKGKSGFSHILYSLLI